MRRRATDRIIIPDGFWSRPETLSVVEARDIGRLFHLVRKYAGASQTQMAIACGMTQGKVSEYMRRGGRQVLALEVFERVADGLDMPDEARMTLGLAPRSAVASAHARVSDASAALADPSSFGSLNEKLSEGEGGDDPVQRRTFHRLTAAGIFGAVLADLPGTEAHLEGVEALAAALPGYPGSTGNPGEAAIDIRKLSTSVVSARHDYQACRYSTMLGTLPSIIVRLNFACETLAGDDRNRAYALSAEAHRLAVGLLFKLDEKALVWRAAERSMHAAQLSEDPIAVAASARALTGAFMSDDRFGAASATAEAFAARLARDVGDHTPDSLSVYGALLLRGAEASGRRNDRGHAATLLDEAEDAARRLGGDHNYRWTAFGPTNVRLHRLHISTELGDLGDAIAQARAVDLDRIPLVERRATLLIDTSRALTRWGKHDKAFDVLCAARHLAPEEVSGRPAVHRLVRDLFATAPPSTKRHIVDFAAQVGVSL